MADYGMIIRKPDGRFWMSPDVTPLIFQGRLDVQYVESSSGQWNTGIPGDRPFTAFARALNGSSAGSIFEYIPINGFWHIRIRIGDRITNNPNAYIRFYLFSNIVKVDSNYGIVFYDAFGRMTWSGDSLPLQMFPVDIPVYGSVNLGFTCACIPTLSNFELEAVFPGVPTINIYSYSGFHCIGTSVTRATRFVEETTGEYLNTVNYTRVFVINTELYDL